MSERVSTVSSEAGGGVWLHRFAVLTCCLTWVLIGAGGLVTSTDSGLSVPDWPLSCGMLMPPMVGGVFYEHGHRMVATLVGLLTLILAVWIWRGETRRWLKRLGFIALLMVIAQGVLGGITVLYRLPTPVSVAHATLAQTFFCVTLVLAFATSREWRQAVPQPAAHPGGLRRVSVVATAAIYGQLVLGAAVRHTGSALAIPDFPLAFGRWVPPLSEASVVIHFLHRLGALVTTFLVAWLALRIWRRHRDDPRFLPLAALLAILVPLQIVLGGAIVWTSRAVFPATAHVLTGALLLGTSWLITLRAHLHWAGPAPAS